MAISPSTARPPNRPSPRKPPARRPAKKAPATRPSKKPAAKAPGRPKPSKPRGPQPAQRSAKGAAGAGARAPAGKGAAGAGARSPAGKGAGAGAPAAKGTPAQGPATDVKKKERPNGEPGAIEGGTDFNNVRDPRPTADDRGDVKKTRQAGQLYQDGIHPKDVEQGAIGDCYLVAGLSSLAKADPQAIRDAIRDNGDGSYRVRFYGEDGKAQYVTVDDELYRKGNAGPRYARGTDQKELWPAIMEKGYAKWKGSYETIGDGGQAGKVMSAITGKYSDRVGNAGQSVDALWDRVNGAVEHNRPIATDTHGKDKKYQTNGLVGNHAYSILGTETDGDDRYVVVRNPWASTEYNAGYNTDVDYDKDGKMDGDDGVFRMKVEDFHRLFEHTDMNGAQKPKTMFQRFMGLFG